MKVLFDINRSVAQKMLGTAALDVLCFLPSRSYLLLLMKCNHRWCNLVVFFFFKWQVISKAGQKISVNTQIISMQVFFLPAKQLLYFKARAVQQVTFDKENI